MATCKLLIEVRKNGDIIMKDDCTTIAECLGVAQSTVARKAAAGGTWRKDGDVYLFRYTGETAPRKNPYEKPAKPKKPETSISDVVRLGRENRLSYGYQSALMMMAKEKAE